VSREDIAFVEPQEPDLRCKLAERAALLQVYKSLGGPDWKFQNGWRQDTDRDRKKSLGCSAQDDLADPTQPDEKGNVELETQPTKRPMGTDYVKNRSGKTDADEDENDPWLVPWVDWRCLCPGQRNFAPA